MCVAYFIFYLIGFGISTEAAGGIVTDWCGKPVHQGGRVIAAANFEIHKEVLQIMGHLE